MMEEILHSCHPPTVCLVPRSYDLGDCLLRRWRIDPLPSLRRRQHQIGRETSPAMKAYKILWYENPTRELGQ